MSAVPILGEYPGKCAEGSGVDVDRNVMEDERSRGVMSIGTTLARPDADGDSAGDKGGPVVPLAPVAD